MKTLEVNGKLIPLKIGLKSLMLLNETPNLRAEENADFILYCILLSNDPNIKMDDLRGLTLSAGDRVKLARELLEQPRPTTEQINSLYCSAVGEIGISPEAVWSMTEEEITLAYEGYMKRQELTANLMLLALRKASNGAWSEIRLLEDKGYSIGTEEERLAVFANLKI